MKAVTLYQPWASLILDPARDGGNPKPVALNRSFACYYTAPIALHAGIKMDVDECVRLHYDAAIIPRAAVLGIIRVTFCATLPHPEFADLESYMVLADPRPKSNPSAQRRFGWKIEVVERFEKPIPARGAKLLWNWDDPRPR